MVDNMTKFGPDTRPSNVTDARGAKRACHAGPIRVVGRRVVEVLVVAAVGGGGPRGFGTSCVLFIGHFAWGRAWFTLLLATGVLVLVGRAAGTVALAAAVPTQITTGADRCAGEGRGVTHGALLALRGVGVGAVSGVAPGAILAPVAIGAGTARGARGTAGQRGPTHWATNARGVSSFVTVIGVGSARFACGTTGGIAKFTGAAFNA